MLRKSSLAFFPVAAVASGSATATSGSAIADLIVFLVVFKALLAVLVATRVFLSAVFWKDGVAAVVIALAGNENACALLIASMLLLRRSRVHCKKSQISASLETSACGWVGVFRADKEWKRLVYRKTISLFVLSYYPSLFLGRKVHVGEPAAAEFLVKKTRLLHRRKKRCVLYLGQKRRQQNTLFGERKENMTIWGDALIQSECVPTKDYA